MTKAKMNNTVKLLGTGLQLHKGEIVQVIPATNQPKENGVQWFARRSDWPDGDSILVKQRDITLRGYVPGRERPVR